MSSFWVLSGDAPVGDQALSYHSHQQQHLHTRAHSHTRLRPHPYSPPTEGHGKNINFTNNTSQREYDSPTQHEDTARFHNGAHFMTSPQWERPTYFNHPAPTHHHHPPPHPHPPHHLSHLSHIHSQTRTPPPDPPINNLGFLVIREGTPSPRPFSPKPSAHLMERTESGLSISSADLTDDNTNDSEPASNFLSDHAAALLVERHMLQYRRRCHNSQHERILKALVTPRARGADFPLDDEALRSIFSAANELFFAGKLSRRVEWDWSTNCSDGGEEGRYAGHVVGTTAIRRNRRWGGYEALIVLSSPILRDDRYNRRLLIATFLHEMIHSFLFVVCGVKARLCGGHTEGFKRIAELIDGWIGKECLRLGDMEADLEWFSKEKKEDLAVPPEMGRVVASSRPGWSAEDGSFIGPRSHNFEQRRSNFDGWQWYGQEGFSTGRQLVEGQYVYPPMQ